MRPPKTKLRVTAGSARGTILALPDGVRPVPSRMKQALFNILGDRIIDATVLDLFSGTGSLGIEAASREAASVVLVERDPGVFETLRSNIQRAHVDDRCTPFLGNAYLAWDVVGQHTAPFDIVFLDPPYVQSENEGHRRDLGRMLDDLSANGLLPADTVLALHVRASAFQVEDLPEQVQTTDVRHYGSGALMICRLRKNTCTT